ncbi:MAG TPA: PP2C family protein-serine/threonine phosphatase [Phycisphaerae bacterium]|nr:PP2C family protein-serine/threonine phosphatase [Phycisphaerae bacterium]
MVATHHVHVLRAEGWRQACEPALLGKADAVIICQPDLHGESDRDTWHLHLQLLADALRARRLTGIVLADDPEWVSAENDVLMPATRDASSAELWGRATTIRQYQYRLRQMDEQVAVMQRLGRKLNQQFVEVDQELRLASRLQRDFLPRSLPEVNDIRFAAIYRPASWVSGDIYDVVRLDETHVGFYLADAVGHGIAAGLLTMFIKQAVTGKVIEQGRYRLLPPGEILARLNNDLARQELPNCQFVTACYGCVDATTHHITFARGGHPHPIHVSASGECREIHTVGGLLGVFPAESFPAIGLDLQPGEKLILYSDGLEDLLIARRDRQQGAVEFKPELLKAACRPAQGFVDALGECMDRAEGSLAPFDDMTVLAIERKPASALMNRGFFAPRGLAEGLEGR